MRFRAPAEQVVQALTAALARRGVQLVQSFDLRTARARHLDVEGCACPHHGTAECTCQYVVALAYPSGPLRAGHLAAPHVLTAHTYEETTLVAVHADQEADPREGLAVMAALMEVAGEMADPCPDATEPCPPSVAEM